MEQVVILVTLGVVGLCLGSFAGATVWRLRAKQLLQDKAEGEPVDKKEYKQLIPLTKYSLVDDRSRCLHCGHTLKWYDLIPLVSWLSTGGKCRYCHQPIGAFEPLIELGTALFFILSFLFWPQPLMGGMEWALFVLWLIAGVLLVILFAYDLKWFILPDRIVFALIGVGAVTALLHIAMSDTPLAALSDLFFSVLILSGIYLTLWIVSKGKWIGFGDVKLGLGLALLLGSWQLAFLSLFLANLIGCLVVLPFLIAGKMTRGAHVPFGPLLIIGCVIAQLFGYSLISSYFSLSL